jgi:uncharacterized membrane protein
MAKEIISTFKEKPKTKIAWWAMGFGLSLLIIPLASGALPHITWGAVNVVPSLLLSLLFLTLITGVIAYRKGECSYILWIGLVPAILFSLLLIAEFTFME